MPGVRPKVSAWQSVRMCPWCGHRGVELQGVLGQREVRCARCRGDLYTRPPRSYAEMEGIPDERASTLEPVWLDAIPAAVLGEGVSEGAVVRPTTREGGWRRAAVGGSLVLIGVLLGFAMGAGLWAALGTM